MAVRDVMIHYKALVGSNGYGLAVEGSDRDVLVVSDEGHESGIHGGLHTIAYTPEAFLSLAPLPSADNLPYLIQWLFPCEVLLETELGKLAFEAREEIIRADLPRIYTGYMAKAEGLSWRLERMYPEFSKRAAYACLFYDILCRYAEGARFAQAHRPEEELRQWLLAVRQGEVETGELAERNRALRKRAEAAAGFYQRPTDNLFLQETERQIRAILLV